MYSELFSTMSCTDILHQPYAGQTFCGKYSAGREQVVKYIIMYDFTAIDRVPQ